jgi:dethiobiotin synthetase
MDARALWEAAGRPGTLEKVCPQRFAAPLAPHLAARAEDSRVDPRLMREGIAFWRESCEIVLVEGAGGLMSPISEEDYNADLAAEFGYPLVIVADNVLGTINATLLTLISADRYGLPVAGIVLNSPRAPDGDASVDSNADELAGRCSSPLLAAVRHGGGFDVELDWHQIASESRRSRT